MFRVTAAEKKHIEKCAERQNLTTARYLRQLSFGVTTNNFSSEDAARLRCELVRVGTNLNQVVHQINARAVVGDVMQLAQLKNDITNIIRQLQQILVTKNYSALVVTNQEDDSDDS